MRKYSLWLKIVLVITAFCGLTYVTVQQNYRQSANDPQIQMAEDLAARLSAGQSADSVIDKNTIDIGKSLAPFVIIFNDQGKSATASGRINGEIPTIPSGVFRYMRRHGEDRFTWETKEGIRSAVVVTSFKNNNQSGFVLAGRSLREVERREKQLTLHVTFVWLTTLFFSFVLSLL